MNKLISTSFLIVCSSLVSVIAFSQQIYFSSGAVASSIDYEKYTSAQFVFSEDYKTGIISPSFALGFESKKVKRFSISSEVSFFVSGGKSDKINFYSDNPQTAKFQNIGFSVIPNFYILNDKSELYIGIGPRFDLVESNLISHYNFEAEGVSSKKFGLTTRLGYNYRFGRFYAGARTNYYPRFGNLVEYKDFFEFAPGADQPSYYTVKVREKIAIDLQIVLGLRFGQRTN